MTRRREPQSRERLDVVDVLRGAALLGILVINSMSILAVNGSTPAFTVHLPVADRLLQDLILFAVESKFYTLFSLLFGISFAIQVSSAERQGARFTPRILRRLAALAVIAIVHITVLWDGDILLIYAITGLGLVLLRKQTTAALKRWITGLLAVPAVLVLSIFVWSLLYRHTPAGAVILSRSDATLVQSFSDQTASVRLAHSNLLAGVHDRVSTYLDLLPLLVSRIPTVLAMFLLGLLIGRSKMLPTLSEHRAVLIRVRAWGLGVGGLFMVFIILATKLLPPTSGLIAIIEDQYIAGPIMSLGIAAAIALQFIKSPNQQVLTWLRQMGRMALTNYLGQSLLLTSVAYGWGLGLATKLNGFQVLGICLLVASVLGLLSHVWMSKFDIGPCEWVWRCATYWRKMPLKMQRM